LFDWAQAREERYEFDGFQPIAMTGGTARHNLVSFNIHRSLHARLQGTGCRTFGQDAGLATTGDAVRYPDALVTGTKFPDTVRLVPGVVVVFEVISPTSGRTDRIEKLREYRAVPSIRRYVILEHSSIGLTVLVRAGANMDWTATTLTATQTLEMPEIGIAIPLAELYQGTDLPATEDPTPSGE
jgi:Uma2 family endonuclease